MLTIDGSQGEGGGQILRTALALALVTGTAFRIVNIRARRRRPGLLQQHLTAVRAAAAIGRAEVKDDTPGSAQLTFVPSGIVPGEYHFDVGTAGSTTLVLQTVLPALLLARDPSRLTLEGGTHNPLAPPFEFLQGAFLPLVNRLGPRVTSTLERHGFAPAGGGRISTTIEPCARLTPLTLLERGQIRRREARLLLANLPGHIADRERSVLMTLLGWPPEYFKIAELHEARGPGNAVLLELESEHVTEVFAAFGQRGVRAEAVAEQAANEARAYLAAGVPVGEHLADQLLLPLALAGGGTFKTLPLSSHARTNIEIVRQFLPVIISVRPEADNAVRVTAQA